ncbi:MAG: ATP-binding protein [Lachnospiraceae bacterium]
MPDLLKKKKTYLILLPILLICLLVLLAYKIWTQYRDTLVENQKEQLLIISESVSQNLSVSLLQYNEQLNFLHTAISSQNQTFLQQYLSTQNTFVCNICQQNKDGTLEPIIYDQTISSEILLSQVDDDNSIWMWNDEQGDKYLVFKKAEQDGTQFCMLVDAEKYYNRLISNLHVGTNGYLVIKASSGILIMHPDAQQWGIDVIEGRKKLYPNLDYSSLSAMIEEQKTGNTGILEYYSYWWTSSDLPKVKKVSAYTTAPIGNDFWIVSTVIDYNDLYEPIKDSFQSIVFIFLGILFIFLIFSFYIGKLIVAHQKAASEIVYLKELNELLEQLHKNEETIAHQQRLQMIGILTGGVAHEFNNFLTPIMGYAELLTLQLPEGSEEQESAQEILDASEKAKDVVRQLSTMSKKNVETVYKNVPAAKTLLRAYHMVESIVPANIELSQKIELNDEHLLCNTTQINQVILNICMNAIHAIGKQSGHIQLRCKTVSRNNLPKNICEYVSDMWSRYLFIDIEDDGCGISPDILKNIFEPFFTTKGNDGTGLGLALAEQIITTHKGYLYVDSQLGKGSTFHILLPVSETTDETGYIDLSNKNSMHFLLADDNIKVLRLLEKNLKKLNLDISTCSRKEEIQQWLDTHPIDVLVLDESLENEDGIEFCMSIQGKYPGLIKILMVNMITRRILEAKQKHIIDGYIEKPVSDVTLMETIRNCR